MVPRRVDEGVHRVGLAPRRPPHAGHGRARNSSSASAATRRWARSRRPRGSSTGSSVLGHGLRAAVVAVDDRDRRAPVALAADQPVAQAVGDGCRWPLPRSSSVTRPDRRAHAPSWRGMPLNGARVDHHPRPATRSISATPSQRRRLPAARPPRGSAGRTAARTRSRAGRGPARP